MSGEIYFYYLFLPLVGGIVPFVYLLKGIKDVVSDPNQKMPNIFIPAFFVFGMPSFFILYYGTLTFFITQSILDDYTGVSGPLLQDTLRLIKSSGMAIGFACLGAGVGLSLIIKEAMKGIIPSWKNLVGYFILAVIPGAICFMALVIAFIIFGKAGVGETDSIGATDLYHATIFFITMTLLSGFLVGYLPTRSDIPSSRRDWIRKLVSSISGLVPMFIGLVYEYLVLGRI